MSCENFKNLILDHTVAELDQPSMSELKIHLEVCDDCREFLSFADLEWKLLDRWELIEPEADYITRFWKRSNRGEEAAKPSFFNLFKSGFLNWSYMPVVSLLLVIVVVAIVYVATENSVVEYTKEDREDEKLLFEVDRTISYDSADMLEIYGVWNFGNDINKGG